MIFKGFLISLQVVLFAAAETPVDIDNTNLIPPRETEVRFLSNTYNAPSNQYETASSQYIGALQFGYQNSYTTPAPTLSFGKGYSHRKPSNSYETPSSSYEILSRSYGVPSHVKPFTSYRTPSSSYVVPYTKPSTSYRTSSSSYEIPSRSYGAPYYNKLSTSYETPFSAKIPSRLYVPPSTSDPYTTTDDGSSVHQLDPADYNFQYTVLAPEYGVEFGQQEKRKYDTIRGKYFVLLPDGRKQVVEYTADDQGYNPVIRYT